MCDDKRGEKSLGFASSSTQKLLCLEAQSF